MLLFEASGDTATYPASTAPATTSGIGNGFAQDDTLGGATARNYDTGTLRDTFTDNLDSSFMTGRHTDGSEFLLCDGHVKYLKSAAVSAGENNLLSTNGLGIGCNGNNGNCASGTGALATGAQATYSVF